MYEIDRICCQRNTQTGLMEWFFDAHQGVYGPFSSKEKAVKSLEKLKDVDRKSNGNVKLSLVPLDDAIYAPKPNVIKIDGRRYG